MIGHWIHYAFPPFEQISYVIPRAMEYAPFFGLSYTREIHDTVGHTLTSAITGLQTAVRLMDKQPSVAADMIHQTKDHIREGLQEVRRSVHMLDEDAAFPDFANAMHRLLEDTRRQAGVAIEADIDPSLPRLAPKVEMTFYRALQEGLTNGIRHGGASEFSFQFKLAPDQVLFELENNGSSWRSQRYAFGFYILITNIFDRKIMY